MYVHDKLKEMGIVFHLARSKSSEIVWNNYSHDEWHGDEVRRVPRSCAEGGFMTSQQLQSVDLLFRYLVGPFFPIGLLGDKFQGE